jgi:DNA-binding transcriptional LysR family regulator
MTLEQLRIFVAVAEQEHVTRAAEKLHLTQSATSAAVAALEERYATKLFDRIGRNIKLTEAGRLFLVEARAVLARATAAETVLVDLAGLKRGSLSLAASQTVGNYWLPALIHRYQTRHPGITLDLTIGNTEQVANRVRDGLADLGFVEGEIDDPTLSIAPVAEDELAFVVGAAHPAAALRAFKPDRLITLSWVVREQGSGTRAIFESALKGLGIASKDIVIALELPSNEAVRTAVEAGAGAALISRLVVAPSLRSGALVELKLAAPRRQFFMLRNKQHYATNAEREFDKLIGDARGAVSPSMHRRTTPG